MDTEGAPYLLHHRPVLGLGLGIVLGLVSGLGLGLGSTIIRCLPCLRCLASGIDEFS